MNMSPNWEKLLSILDIYPTVNVFNDIKYKYAVEKIYTSLVINDFKLLLPEFFLGTCLLGLLIYGVMLVAEKRYNYPIITKNMSSMSILILFLTLLLIVNSNIPYSTIFNNTFIIDDLSNIIKISILTSMILCLIISQNYMSNAKLNSFEYFILVLLATLGLLLLVSSYDLISAYLAIELQSLSFYILAAFKRNSAFSTEAGLKYFILGAFSSGLILYGSSLIYGFLGTTNFENIATLLCGLENDYNSIGLKISIVFIAIGLLFKLAAAPFHMWSPDVYEGAPTSSTIIFAVVPKIAIFVLFSRLYQVSFYNLLDSWQQIILFASFFSIIIGSFVSLKQRKLKRLFAYSAIGHVGYLLLSFAVVSVEGVSALFFYLFIYMITGLCLWSLIMSLEIETVKNNTLNKNISDLANIVQSNPICAITFSILLFSLAGIPPLAGFYAKMQIFMVSIKSSIYFLSSVIIVSSVISTFYYLRIIKLIQFEKVSNWNFYKVINKKKSLILAITSYLLIFLFIEPNLLSLISFKLGSILFI